MFRYYTYRLKKSLPTLVVALVFGIMFTITGLLTDLTGYFSSKKFYIVDFEVYTILFYIEAFVFAYLEFASFRNKRNLDTWFSFPLSRKKIAIVHMLNVVTLYAIQTFVYTIVALPIMSSQSGLNYLYFFAGMFALFVYYCLMFCAVSVTFLFANTTSDGAVSVIAWINLPSAILTAYNVILEYAGQRSDFYDIDRLRLGINGPIESICADLEYRLNVNVIHKYESFMRSQDAYFYDRFGLHKINDAKLTAIIIWLVLFVIAAIAIPYVFSKRPTEKIGGISDFFLCYDFLIPFYALFMILVCQEVFILKLFLIPATYVAYCVYRKTPKITWKRFGVLAVLFVIAMIPFLEIFGIK